MVNINIVNTIKSEFAVSPEDGDIIYSLIKDNLLKNLSMTLDFSDVDIMTTAFLNNAIGKLYKTFDKEQLNQLISMQNVSDSDLVLIKKVIERAKLTFTDELKEEFGDE